MTQTRVHVISHTHWDREWYLPFEQYRARLVDLVDAVLDRMAADPRFTFFHLDGQTVVVEDYLEIRPEREVEFRQRVAEGRLLIGPWYVMPDMFLVSGESLVRNLARGIRIATSFGKVMEVGYIPDPFGHVAQMPQILRGFGLDGAILWRGFGGRRSEYAWRAPDGSRVLLLHLPLAGYCNGLRLPLLPAAERWQQAAAVIAAERERSTSRQVLLMVGVDHVEPHPAMFEVIEDIDAMSGTDAKLSTLPAYVRAVEEDVKAATLEVVDGELRGGQDYAHLLPGVFSARTYLKRANARVQRELEHWAEPLAVMAGMVAGVDPNARGMLRYAWRTLLQNHPHDSICGCSVDAVHEENMTRFARAHEAASTVVSGALRAIARALPAGPTTAIRCLATQTDIRPWSGVIDTSIEIPLRPIRGTDPVDLTVVQEPLPLFGDDARVASVSDHTGRGLPFQINAVEEDISFRMSRFAPPPGVHVRRVHLSIALDDVPPLGYTAFDVHIASGQETPVADAAQATADPARSSIENERLRVEVTPDGTVALTDKVAGTRYDGLFTLEDVGDVGDEYNYSPPARNARVTSADAQVRSVRVVQSGPVKGVLELRLALPVPESAAPDRQSRSATAAAIDVTMEITLRARSAIVEARVRVTNSARDHRLRILCPAGAATVPVHRADTAFAVVTRSSSAPLPEGPLAETPVPPGPMLSFVDAGDDTIGATVIADGLVEYEIVQHPAQAFIAVTLLRCVGDLSRDDLSTRKGHAGPGLRTPAAQCLGEHEFALAFAPRARPPLEPDLCALARRFLSPPRTMSFCGGGDRCAAHGSVLPVDTATSRGAVLSACKPADEGDAVILRFFNPSSETARVALHSSRQAFFTDLAERPAGAVASLAPITVDLAPYRIQTIALMRDGDRD